MEVWKARPMLPGSTRRVVMTTYINTYIHICTNVVHISLQFSTNRHTRLRLVCMLWSNLLSQDQSTWIPVCLPCWGCLNGPAAYHFLGSQSDPRTDMPLAVYTRSVPWLPQWTCRLRGNKSSWTSHYTPMKFIFIAAFNICCITIDK